MKPLDQGQEREAAFLRSQPSAWVNLTFARRLLRAPAIVAPLALLGGVITAVAGGPWALVALGVAVLIALPLLPHLLVPERMLRVSVRMQVPTVESMRRGDNNRNWPG